MDLFVCARCVLFVSSVVLLTESFNIDVRNAVVHRGKNGSAFGYTAEFIQYVDNRTRLIVGAPREKVTARNYSGIHHYCVPQAANACTSFASPPEINYQRDGRFSEDSEFFGLSMAMADRSTALVCGPMWSDLKFWQWDYIFNVGRCRLLPAPDNDDANGPGVLPYYRADGRGYIANISVHGRVTNQMLNGAAEFGFSADSDGTGKVVIGAPGYSVSRGGFGVYDVKTKLYHRMEMILDQDTDIVLGYDVTVGNFCGAQRFCFAVSNRQISGKVYLIEHVPESRVQFRVLWSDQAKQEYSSFGSVLCATDVTGDGWADLLVGAPTHSHTNTTTTSTNGYDQGRVFVYLSHGEAVSGDDNFDMAVTLAGDSAAFSRFGSAIASIGDINRDSFNDIAVGAPLDGEGAGAIYIYLGGAGGPGSRYSQKIGGRDFQPPLTSLGSHISKPTSQLSAYGYPDFAVGAPESDALVFLKTRLIINANVSVQATPNPVDPTNEICPPSVPRGSGCLNISVCLNYTYRVADDTQATEHGHVEFDVSLEVDRLISSDASRRVHLYEASSGALVSTYNTSLTVQLNRGLCQHHWAVLNKDQIDRNPFVPVYVHANFSLNMTSFHGTVPPILNQSMPDSHSEQVKFKNKCGEDGVCETDLVLSGHVQHVPSGDSTLQHINVVNQTQQVELVLDVLNNGETSFGVQLTINISGQITFRVATGNTSVLCSAVQQSLIRCSSWGPLGEGAAVRIRLQFLADTVPLTSDNKVIRFEVKVMPYDPVENPEVKAADNKMALTSRTAIVADLKLDGWADPRQAHVQDSDQNDVTLTHKLLLVNRGPSFLPATSVLVRLPFVDSTGVTMLTHSNVTIRLADGQVAECPPHLGTGGSQGGGTSTQSTTTTTTTLPPTTTTPATTGSKTTTADPFGPIIPSRRRRRQAENGQNDDVRDGGDGKVLKIDCVRAACRVYQCYLPHLAPNHKAEINVTLTLLRSALNFPGSVDSLQYTTTTSVTEPDHPLFYPWQEQRLRQVRTLIKRVSSGDEINIWIIIGGVIGGLLLLIIIAIVAWRCGFFARKDRAKLERLKRQSGFYESKGSVKRKSQRPPSSASSGAQK